MTRLRGYWDIELEQSRHGASRNASAAARKTAERISTNVEIASPGPWGFRHLHHPEDTPFGLCSGSSHRTEHGGPTTLTMTR